jgi:hypothetical protein
MPAIHAGMTNSGFSSFVPERKLMNHFVVKNPVLQRGMIESSRVKTYVNMAANIKSKATHTRQSLWGFQTLTFCS